MDSVEIFLFYLVGFSALVFLVLDNLGKGKRKARQHEEEDKEEAEKALVSAVSSSSLCVKEDYFTKVEKPFCHHGEDDEENEEEKVKQEVSSEKSNLFDGGEEEKVGQEWAPPPPLPSLKEDYFPKREEENEGEKVEHLEGEVSSEKSNLFDGGGEEEKKVGQEWFDDDDCEGVERSELEKLFGDAVVFVGCNENADLIGDKLRLELYGLQKVAFEGPCNGPQPMLMALNSSARSNWNSWQKVGGISREEAMERYVDVLSKAVPVWKMGS